MSNSEVILCAGVAGGVIALYGARKSDGSWLFFHEMDESFHENLLSDEDKDGLVFRHKSDVSDALEKALKQLDEKYEWHRFYPVRIHPEFAHFILNAVRKRCMDNSAKTNYLFEWQHLVENPAR